MHRRAAIAALLATSLLARASMANEKRRKRIAYVAGARPQKDLIAKPRAFPGPRALIDGLRQRGWREGENIEFVWRSAERRKDRLQAIFDELIAMPVDVLVINTGVAVAMGSTKTIPIVINGTGSSEVLRSDGSKNFPANVTGTLWYHPQTPAKTLELLKEAVPGATRVAVAFDEALLSPHPPDLEGVATAMNITLIASPYSAAAPEGGLDRARKAGANAVYFRSSPGTFFESSIKPLHAWARRHRMPAIYGYLEGAETGGLIAYAPDQIEPFRKSAYFVDRILRGTRPEDLPLEQPSVIRLIVNLDAAREIGLVIPPQVLLRADRVIGKPSPT